MQVSSQGIALIQRFEGFSPTAYVCPGGYWTIGYGHVLRSPDSLSEPISEAEAEALLIKDVEEAERAVRRYIAIPLAQHQWDALASFTFNLGPAALQRSTLRRKVNRAEHEAVPRELTRWVYAGGRKLAGLVRRRQAEAALYQKK